MALIQTASAATFDNSGSGSWTEYFSFPITTVPAEYAQYKIVISGTSWEIYNVTGALEASGTNSNFWSLVQSDGDDIRVFNQTGQLYFNITSFDYTNQTAEIWVNVYQGSAELNIAYGNPAANKSAYDDPTQVFDYYDDFSTDTSTNYNLQAIKYQGTSTAALTVSNGVMSVTLGADGNLAVVSQQTVSDNFAIELDVQLLDVTSIESAGIVLFGSTEDVVFYLYSYTTNEKRLAKFTSAGYTLLDSASWTRDTNWHKLKLEYANGQFKYYFDGVLVNSYAYTLTDASYNVGMIVNYYANSQSNLDNFRVYKLADPADFGTPSVKSFAINFTVNLVSPANNSFLNTSSVNFVFNINGTADSFTAKLFIDGQQKWNGSASVGDNTVTLTVADGQHSWYVEVTGYNSTANVTKVTETWYFTVDGNPPSVVTADYQGAINAGELLVINISWSDAVGLDRGEFYVKENGTWTLKNSTTFSGTQAWFNVTYSDTVNKTIIEFKQVVYDVAGHNATYSATVAVVKTLLIGNGTKAYYFRFVDELGEIINPTELEYIKFISMSLGKVYVLENATAVTYRTNITHDEIRVEFKYKGTQTIVTRDFETDILDLLQEPGSVYLIEIPNSSVLPFYEQILYSSTNKPVIVKNTITGAYIAAARTKYTYQDALMLPAYTVSGMYYLYTFDNGQTVLLGTIEGTRSVMINLDILQSLTKSYSINILGDDVSISKEFNNTLKIYYSNQKNDNQKVIVRIYNYSDGTLLFNHTETVSPNEFTLYFDYTTLNVSNSTLFKIEIEATKTDGSTKTTTRLFDLNGNSGQVDPALVVLVSLSFALFGLTLTASRYALGVFGIISLGVALALTTLAVQVWYIKFTQAVLLVLLVYVFLVYKHENVGVT
ncbi:DUF2341 domain-containing protein [Geoglobus ahangari]